MARKKSITRKKVGGRKKPRSQLRARDFGDDPDIRGGRDRARSHKLEPWEVRYREEKKLGIRPYTKEPVEPTKPVKVKPTKLAAPAKIAPKVKAPTKKGLVRPTPEKKKPTPEPKKGLISDEDDIEKMAEKLGVALKGKGYRMKGMHHAGEWFPTGIDSDRLEAAVKLNLTANDIVKYTSKSRYINGRKEPPLTKELPDEAAMERIALFKSRGAGTAKYAQVRL